MCRNVCVLSSSWSDSEWFIRHRLSLCFMLFILQKPFLWMEHFVKVTAFRFPCWVVLPYDTDCILCFPRGLEKWHPSENPWDSTSNLRWVTPSTHPPEMFQKKKKKKMEKYWLSSFGVMHFSIFNNAKQINLSTKCKMNEWTVFI